MIPPSVGATPHIPLSLKIEEKENSKSRAIQICQEKYPSDFKQKKIIALAIVIGTLSLTLLSVVGSIVAALTLASPLGIVLLVATPLAIVGIGLLIKKIDDKTLYWSRGVANGLIEKKAKEEKEAREKEKDNACKVAVSKNN
ncbi:MULTISPECIES: hypothetical protein [unclassified Neochlamydia]|uniref:hypothetical protein n=1 Tax=unclassified Neochlamydia TaxID=2643326 RepID=UPI001BC8E33D|nr:MULTISPECIES: hypothetical protein [unclassified Neochlamydia]MBS4166909.1 Uncharacterized protein [Neochlamydia sp. AcF65]MBS4170615.1 Uncharacterized protein [Neochlamydia sp. AcF95]